MNIHYCLIMMIIVTKMVNKDEYWWAGNYNTIVRYIVHRYLDVSISIAWANEELNGHTSGPYVIKMNANIPIEILVTIHSVSIQCRSGKIGVWSVSRHWVLTITDSQIHVVLYEVVQTDNVVMNIRGEDGVIGVYALKMDPPITCRVVLLFETRIIL